MGAWGVLAFDNDDANDWAYGLDKVHDLSLVEKAFSAVENAGDYLEAPDACNALAACELLARLKGNFGYQNAYTKKGDDWVSRHPIKPTSELLARASGIIDRILGERSELRDLWQDSDFQEWTASIEELRQRMMT